MPHPASLIQAVASALGLTVDELTGPSRQRHVVQARQLAAFVLRTHCPAMSLSAIAAQLGWRDHATVLHALTRAPAYLTDPAIRACLTPLLPALLPVASPPPPPAPAPWQAQRAMRWWATQGRTSFQVVAA